MIARYLNERFLVMNGKELLSDRKKFMGMFAHYSKDMEIAEEIFFTLRKDLCNLLNLGTDKILKYISGKDFFVMYGIAKSIPGGYGEVSLIINGCCFEENGALSDNPVYDEHTYITNQVGNIDEAYKIAVARLRCYEKYLMNVSNGKDLGSVIRKFIRNQEVHGQWGNTEEWERWKNSTKPI